MQPHELRALEYVPSTARRTTFVYILHTAVVVGGLLGGGMSVGYYAGTESSRTMLFEERRDRLAEIARLQESHQSALDVISGRQMRTADRLAQTADTVAQTADTLAQTTDVASTAAETAQVAAKTATKAAQKVGVAGAAVTESDRRVLNAAVQKANTQIREAKP